MVHLVLIVAKCNVNTFRRGASIPVDIVLIVAKCNVNELNDIIGTMGDRY